METQMTTPYTNPERLIANAFLPNKTAKNVHEFQNICRQLGLASLEDFLSNITLPGFKKSFLVAKINKYISIPTDSIAFFHIKYKHQSAELMCFNKQEYFVNYSLDQLQQVLPGHQFFRLNRQYLINFNAIKEVERCYSRKLLINAVIPVKDDMLVPKEKVGEFLHWLDNR